MKVVYTVISALLLIRSVAGIIGGTEVPKDEKMYMARLTRNRGISYYPFCGGVLISDHHVLTSAMCVTDKHPNYVLVGDHRSDDHANDENFEVTNVTIHPKFKTEPAFNFALLTLAKNTTNRPVLLPEPDTKVKAGDSVVVLTYGLDGANRGRLKSFVLREMKQKLVANEDCAKAFERAVDKSEVCGSDEEVMSTCDGDGGGPAIYENAKGDTF